MDFLTCLFHIFRINLVLRYIHTNHISHFFWWHYFFLELQNILKKERTEGAPVQNLPLFTTAIGKLKLNCKSFGSNHLILEMPHDNVAHLAVLSPFQSIHSPSSIYHHMKVDKFHCCGQGHYCQWCTTLSCHMKLPFGVQEA